ncbi:hypothetical protein IscW_ISCW017533, partial [Ixodes scapularis]
GSTGPSGNFVFSRRATSPSSTEVRTVSGASPELATSCSSGNSNATESNSFIDPGSASPTVVVGNSLMSLVSTELGFHLSADAHAPSVKSYGSVVCSSSSS